MSEILIKSLVGFFKEQFQKLYLCKDYYILIISITLEIVSLCISYFILRTQGNETSCLLEEIVVRKFYFWGKKSYLHQISDQMIVFE